MILAGDIGGTNARLAYFDVVKGKFSLVSATIFPSRNFSSLDEIAANFVDTMGVAPDVACFGIAGPVLNGRVETSNLPWVIEASKLSREIGVKNVVLINDLEATGWGISALDDKDLVRLNAGTGVVGNQAVIAAGTGLGEAGLHWDGTQHHVFACEGGHTDFAPRNELEMDLLHYLTVQFGHVSYERVLSGPGLVNVFHFLRDTGRGSEPKWLTDEMHETEPAAAISRAAMEGKCSLCEQTVDIFVSIYGAEAGNLGLKMLATGGVFLAGGIAPKILSKLAEPFFMQAFLDKGRMRPLLEAMPVHVITNDKIALLGAAQCGLSKSESPVSA
ncbi:MAG TPA: glucokinase [Terriglobales bacterium]|jgi:glucokinase